MTALVVVARSRAPLDRSISKLVWGIVWAVGASCLVIVLVVAFTVRRGLAPLVKLGDQVDGIAASTLSARFPTEEQPREIRPLSTKLNELLVRLEGSFQRERRMTANMAHELRTPIAELRSATDVARKWPDDDTLYREAVDAAYEVSAQMGRVVDSLLRLSRTEAGREELQPELVDLSRVASAAWERFEVRAREKEIAIEASAPAGLLARTDPDLVGLIVRNLVDNAVSHTPNGGRIESRVENGGSEVVWTLQNAPVELDSADLERIAEPLWTKEAARSKRDHSGLGLPLVRAVAAALGITLEFTLEGNAFRAAVHVPQRFPVGV